MNRPFTYRTNAISFRQKQFYFHFLGYKTTCVPSYQKIRFLCNITILLNRTGINIVNNMYVVVGKARVFPNGGNHTPLLVLSRM